MSFKLDSLPDIKIKPFDKLEAIEYKIEIDNEIISEKLKELSDQNKQFIDKKKKMILLK